MRIIEIEALPNNGHRNQTWNGGVVPNGFAVIPNSMETPNFPFGTVTVEEINGIMTVTKWTAGEIPEDQETEKEITTAERLEALEAAMLEMTLGGAE